jgi:hypothetical protein
MEQMNNTRFNRRITFRETTQNISQWARALGVSPNCIRYRLDHWPIDQALTLPPLICGGHKVRLHGRFR